MIYVFRKEFGVSAHELFTEMPEWERDVLLAEREADLARIRADRGN